MHFLYFIYLCRGNLSIFSHFNSLLNAIYSLCFSPLQFRSTDSIIENCKDRKILLFENFASIACISSQSIYWYFQLCLKFEKRPCMIIFAINAKENYHVKLQNVSYELWKNVLSIYIRFHHWWIVPFIIQQSSTWRLIACWHI